MGITFGGHCLSQVRPRLGESVALPVTKLGRSDKVCAVAVDLSKSGLPCMNATPHVTLAVAPGSAPKFANDIERWVSEPPGLEIHGSVCEASHA